MKTTSTVPVETANSAVLQRFNELPASRKDEFVNELIKVDQYLHFRRYVCKDGWDLAKTKAATARLITEYLGIGIGELCNNSIKKATFVQFHKPTR